MSEIVGPLGQLDQFRPTQQRGAYWNQRWSRTPNDVELSSQPAPPAEKNGAKMLSKFTMSECRHRVLATDVHLNAIGREGTVRRMWQGRRLAASGRG